MSNNRLVQRVAYVSLCVMLFLIPIFSALYSTGIFDLTVVQAVNNDTKFANTNVLEDLKSSTVNGKTFDITDYPYNENDKPSIVNFVEYCYSFKANLRANYGLYIYVYNPSGVNFDVNSKQNKIQLAVGYGEDKTPNNYEKFDLEFCNKSEETNYKNLFYKFKIVDRVSTHDNKSIAMRVNSHERRYDVSGFEILTKGHTNAIDYTVGGTYLFSGFVKGYGADENDPSTLQSSVNDLETVSLDLKSTYFRTGVSAEGKGHQNQLNSVYFSVPNELLKKYGSLQKINAEWWEYRTEMIGITNKSNFYQAYLPYVGDIINGYNSNIPFEIFTKSVYYDHSYEEYWYPFNVKPPVLGSHVVHDSFNYMPFWFYTQKQNLQDYTLSGAELYEYIQKYKRADRGYLPVKDNISADLFSENIDEGRTRGYNKREIDSNDKFNMLSYDSTVGGSVPLWFQKFKDYGFFAPSNTGGDYVDVAPVLEIKPNEHISGDNKSISNKLCIVENDVNDFKSYVSNATKNEETAFLFRFANTDYFCDGAYIRNPGAIVFTRDAYLSYETVFFDFDILQLTFNKEGTYKVIPVVASPIDIIPDITPPIVGGLGEFFGFNLKMIILVICIALLVLIFLPLLFNLFRRKNKNDVVIHIKDSYSEKEKNKRR